eukprot:scaffold45128_cov33-Cyclotella_meneghiniana.AAC.1
MERTLLLEEERGYNNNNIDNHDFFDYYDNHHHCGSVVFHMSAKDTLRLLQMLLRWIMGGRGGARGITGGSGSSSSHGVDESQYSHVGVFTCHLLHHFANMTLTESGMYTTFHECRDLFRVWVEGGVQEHNHNHNMDMSIPRRLSNEDANVVLDLITTFQISSIQSAYHLVERADAMIVSLSCQDVDNGSTGTSNDIIRSDSCAAAFHESIRHVGIVVSVTEVMEKLGLEIDPEMH